MLPNSPRRSRFGATAAVSELFVFLLDVATWLVGAFFGLGWTATVAVLELLFGVATWFVGFVVLAVGVALGSGGGAGLSAASQRCVRSITRDPTQCWTVYDAKFLGGNLQCEYPRTILQRSLASSAKSHDFSMPQRPK